MVGRKIPLFLMVLTFIASSRGKQLYEMTNREIDSLLTVISKRNLTITERMNFYSEKFLGTPYNLRCVGDGPYALLENWPLVNFKETNCMAYCEHVLALYMGDVTHTDEQVGKVTAKLKELNLEQDTMLIIVSDHGEGLGEHCIYGDHGKTLYAVELKIPFMIY